jgi:hypothetical protein
VAMWSVSQALEVERILLIQGHRRQCLVVREGVQGPVFTHRVPRQHSAQVGFGSPLQAYVQEVIMRAGEFQDHAGTQKAALTKRRWGRGGEALWALAVLGGCCSSSTSS